MSFTRRAFNFLLGAGALTSTAAKAKLPPADYDCIVVGAGAAGISAARELQAGGNKVLVLEARSRLGGRAWTDTETWGLPFDRGAAWVEHFSANPLRHELKRQGLKGVSTSPDNSWIFDDGEAAPKSDMRQLSEAEGKVLGRMKRLARRGEDRALGDLVESDAPWQRMVVDLVASATLGTAPENISALDLALREGEGDRLLPAGLGAFITAMAAGLDVRCNAVVTRINAEGSICKVETKAGTIEARSVLVTVPADLLISGDIEFAPPIPAGMADDFSTLSLGTYEKVAFKLTRNLYEGHDFAVSGTLARNGQPHAVHVHPLLPIVTVLYGAGWADEVGSGGAQAKIGFGESAIKDVFGSDVAKLINGPVIATDWRGDPFARGSYAAARPGRIAAREAYKQNLNDRVFFAGEADATGQSATVGGAWLSGQRVARDIASRL